MSAPVAEEYGFSLTELARTAGPGRFLRTLASGYDPRSHGDVKPHFNAFGGFSATVEMDLEKDPMTWPEPDDPLGVRVRHCGQLGLASLAAAMG